MIETLGQARNVGVKISARCAWGPENGMKRVRECKATVRLDLETLIWTRGESFPISMLSERLKCPQCGSRRVAVLFDLPEEPVAKGA